MAKADAAKKPGLIDYFKHVRLEIKKVIWPTKKELVSYTAVVIFVCFILGLAIWVFDTGVSYLIRLIFRI